MGEESEGKNEKNLREVGALSPNTAVLADDSGGSEVVTFDVAHKVVIDVGLPRHGEEGVSDGDFSVLANGEESVLFG